MSHPISLIKSDHRRIVELFETYKNLSSAEAKDEIASQIIKEITVHAKMEEKIFYPKLRSLLEETNPKIVEDALAEHHAAKILMLELRLMNVTDPRYDSLIKVLEDSTMRHIEEEENTLLPFANDVLPKNEVDDLGKEMKTYSDKAHKSVLEKLFT